MRAVVGGLIGGAIGAAIWGAVVLFTGYEYGWIAWGIGGLVGLGVAIGNQDGGRAPMVAGSIAVAIAAVSILGGKLIAVGVMTPSDEELLAIFTDSFLEEEFVVSYVADDVATEYEEAGRTVVWPEEVDPDFASAAADYPADVWAEASSRWDAMTDAERQAFTEARQAESRAEAEASLPEIRSMIATGGFFGSFSPMDLIFFGLAMTTAFGLGSGGNKSDEEIAEEFAEAVQLAMIEVMIADGNVDPEEVHVVATIYKEMTGADISDEVVRAKATLAQTTGKDLNAALTELVPHLNDQGKATVLQAAVKVAIADGDFDAREQLLLMEISGILGMTDEQMRQTVGGLMEATEV